MLHVLLHMARYDGSLTSEQIANMLGTNPVLVRRTMAGLRRTGYVRSEKGHGGGWSLARDLNEITLLDIHNAIGGPKIFAIGNMSDNPHCAVERVVNATIDDALQSAEALLLKRLSSVRLSDLANEFERICSASGWDDDHWPTDLDPAESSEGLT